MMLQAESSLLLANRINNNFNFDWGRFVKAISVSSDQLDTMTSRQAQLSLGSRLPALRASYRLPEPADVVIKYKGSEYSKNEYFFGVKSEPAKKTPYQMFLEDDGPYSRKLYGGTNIKSKAQLSMENLSFKNLIKKKSKRISNQTV